MLSWQEKVLTADSRYIVARVCRRAGKTFTGVNWAVSTGGESVLYVVPFESQVKLVLEMIKQYKGLHLAERGNTVYLTNATTVTVVSAQALEGGGVKGRKVTRIVVDEAGSIIDEVYEHIAPLLFERKDSQILLLTSTYKKGSLMDAVTSKQPSSAVYLSYDYVDMLNEQEITPAEVFQFQSAMSKATFADEFGPYTTFNIDNQMMEHVLRAMDEYV